MKHVLPITTALVSSMSLAWGADDSSRIAAPRFPAAPNFVWSGFYLGGSLGSASLNGHATGLDAGNGCWWACADLRGLTDTSQGVIGGVQLGANWQYGPMVLGLEADLSAASNSGKFNTFCDPSGACDYSQHSRLSAIDTVRGRLGYALDRSLFYATGGWATADIHNRVSDLSNVAVWDFSERRGGWTAGGGLEYALSNAWSVKVEALYYDLGEKTTTFVYSGKGTLYYPEKFHNDGVIARMGLNFRFGDPAVPLLTRY
jgi:outer membrane immunogenic protein